MASIPVPTARKNKFMLCMNLQVAALALLPLSLAAQTTQPASTVAPPTAATLKAGQQSVNWLFRFRLESVDQDGLAENALASTLLSRLTVLQGLTEQFSAGVEFDYVAVLGDTSYNNSLNGKTRYPLIADPAGSDLNQAFVQYQHQGHQLKVGRQAGDSERIS